MRVVQRGCNYRVNAIGIAEHLVVPEANDSIAFIFDDFGAFGVGIGSMLPAVDLDDELCRMAREIDDETPQRYLLPPVELRKREPKKAPHREFGFGWPFS